MIKMQKPILLTAVISICLFSGQAATYAQNVTVPREPTTRDTRDTDGPKPASRGPKIVLAVLEVLTKIVCQESGNCPQSTDVATENPSPSPQEFDRGKTRTSVDPKYHPRLPQNFSFYTPLGWQTYEEQSSVTIAAPTEYVNGNLTNGVIVGLSDLNGASFESGTDRYVLSILSVNKYLKRVGSPQSNVLNSVACIATPLVGLSPQTGYTENVLVYTCRRSTQSLFYVVNVNSGPNANRYQEENSRVIQSISFRSN